MSALFPTICAATCARYIAAARRTTNAVSEQIRHAITLQRGSKHGNDALGNVSRHRGVPKLRRAASLSPVKRLTTGHGGLEAPPSAGESHILVRQI